MLANLVSAGTLIAFTVASAGVIVARKRKDIDHTGYKLPFYPILPLLGMISSILLLLTLNKTAQILMLLWIVLGTIFYIFYSRTHSKNYKKYN